MPLFQASILIVGPQVERCDSLMWSPLDYPCRNGPKGGDCTPHCLYDIIGDPQEKNNLIDKEPGVLKMMLDKYNAYSKEPCEMQDQGYHDVTSLPVYKDACKYMNDNGGYWRPWKNV